MLGVTVVPAVGTIVVCECRFRDDAAFDASLASPETRRVMVDVARLTNAALAGAFSPPFEGVSA